MGLALALEQYEAANSKSDMELTAAVIFNDKRLSNKSKRAVNEILKLTNCKNSSALRACVSTEGLFDFIVEHYRRKQRRRLVLANIIIAYITWADKKTKNMIWRAEKNYNIKLPFSAWQITALEIAWVATASFIGVVPSLIMTAAGGAVIGITRSALKEKVDKAVDKVEAQVEKAKAAKHDGRTSDTRKTVGALKKLSAQISKTKTLTEKMAKSSMTLPDSVKKVSDKFNNAEAKQTLMDRIKNIGTIISGAFKMLWACIKALPAKLKRKPKEA